ncbi:unnamed protein product [Pieris brassicae]|uniref:Major facilitator superfamily (MFS) profile domain-containing protein n=1 Tax=Pieris brassicae TaxID=7116 RepID=A0A9P0X4Z7_PIEBR|nr:unnamed protein product [Pieris brassicae]
MCSVSETSSRSVQYLAGLSVSFAFTFTGAVLSWPSPAIPKFKNGEANVQITDEQSSWVVALCPLGALLGCYFGQVLNEKVGRRRTILASVLPGLIALNLVYEDAMAYVRREKHHWCGKWDYCCEIADKEIRGAIGMLVQVMMNIGSLLVYGIGPFVSYTVLNSIVLSFVILYGFACLWVPESPYYHLKDGRLALAKKEFMFIKGTKDDKWASEQLAIMRSHVVESMANKTTTKELFTNVRYRKALYVVAGLKVLQYMTGTCAIQAYLEPIFRQSSSVSGPYVSIVYGFVQLAAGITATFLTGCVGRRVLMLTSSIGVAISLTAVGIYFFLQDYYQLSAQTLSSISAIPLVGVLGFNILYSIGLGNLPYIMQAELFPINVKTVASSLATMMAAILNFFVTKSYQGIKDFFGHYTVFWSFASIAYFGIFFIYFFVPETKGKTLEEVQDNLNVEAVEMERLNKEKQKE